LPARATERTAKLTETERSSTGQGVCSGDWTAGLIADKLVIPVGYDFGFSPSAFCVRRNTQRLLDYKFALEMCCNCRFIGGSTFKPVDHFLMLKH
jgi:hypothetical protein